MYIDKDTLMSEDQAVTTTATSTNVLDLGAMEGHGNPIPLLVQVTQTFATCTSVTFALTECATADGSFTVKAQSGAIAVADLVAGKQVLFGIVPKDTERYLKMSYTVAGSAATAGKVTAGLAVDIADV
jgi:hypothetical protein